MIPSHRLREYLFHWLTSCNEWYSVIGLCFSNRFISFYCGRTLERTAQIQTPTIPGIYQRTSSNLFTILALLGPLVATHPAALLTELVVGNGVLAGPAAVALA